MKTYVRVTMPLLGLIAATFRPCDRIVVSTQNG